MPLPRKKHGGPRPGAGRPKGKVSKPSRKLTEALVKRIASDDKPQPLEIIIQVMHFHWDASQLATDPRDLEVKLAALRQAAKYAEMAAPYMHPKLASTEVKNMNQLPIQVVLVDDIPDTPLEED